MLPHHPIVSIITPTFNSEDYIEKTLVSIINQTYKNWELLITDDCSVDNTVDIVKEFINEDERIKLFILEKNSGAGIARNNSIGNAKGRFISFCDSDDYWLPIKLETQINFMINKKVEFSFCSYFVINEKGIDLGIVEAPSTIGINSILRNNYVGCSTAVYDTLELGKLYMSSIRKRQDWVLWIQLIKKIGEGAGIDKPLAFYRKRKTSVSNNKLNLIKYNWRVYHNELQFNLFKSLVHMVVFFYFYFKKKLPNKS